MRSRDETFMAEAMRLAEKGIGRTHPNPMVGAVVVKEGRIIARGYHRRAGEPHAERRALDRAGKRARGATLYVNLEPCCHQGKTPPCTAAIIRAGIKCVVFAERDPNPVARGGAATLRRAGIAVSVGVLRQEARRLNEAFYTFHERGRPFVAVKYAMSADGKLASRTGDSKWITNEEARAEARRLRGVHQAVVVGIGTVLSDNPRLTARSRGARDPIKIILDSRLRIPLSARALRGGNVIIAATRGASAKKKESLERRGARVIELGARISISRLLRALHELGIMSILVEGGGSVLGSCIDARVVDRVYAFVGPILIGGRRAAAIGGTGAARIADSLRLCDVTARALGDTVLIEGRVCSKA